MVLTRISGPVVVLAAWIMALSWLLHDDRYQLFLNPKFGFLVYISLGVSLVFCISLLASRRPRFPETGHLVKGMILMLPILFMGAAGSHTLGSFALSKRMLTPLQNHDTRESVSPDSILGGPNASGPVADPAGPAGGDRQQAEEISMAELVRNWPHYNGRHIRVEGLFSPAIEDHDHLSAVFRYFIVCCVADAMPVGVFLEKPQGSDLKENDWVRISGRVVLGQLEGYDIIFMETPAIEKTDPPSKTAAYIFD
jgi:putative membrane protein